MSAASWPRLCCSAPWRWAPLWLATNAAHNMQARGLASGFAFMGRPAGFDISEHLIPFGPEDSNARVFIVGALNTLLVASLGIVGATVLGFIGGAARLSRNLMVRGLATAYVELVRNIPAAIQILLWYSLIYLAPPPRAALRLGGMVLSNRGLLLPAPVWHGAMGPAVLLAAIFTLGGIWGALETAPPSAAARRGTFARLGLGTRSRPGPC